MTLFSSIARAKRYLYRLAKYRILSPEVPSLAGLLQGQTVVVLGSAPLSTRPAGMDESFKVVTINASQAAARSWLTVGPDVTLMQFNQIEGKNPGAEEVRRVLSGQGTKLLYMLHWRHDRPRLERGLAAFDYGYQQLLMMSRYERIALMHEVAGTLNLELDAGTKWSNGVIATALAIQGNAARVILTGIDPMSQGHAYNGLRLSRLHADMDAEALKLFIRKGYPIFTADPWVSKRLDLPLWTADDLPLTKCDLSVQESRNVH